MIFNLVKDSELILDDGNSYSSSGAGKVSSSATFVDLGADYTKYPVVYAVIDVTALTTNSSQTYDLEIEFSGATGFSTISSQLTETITTTGQYNYAFIPKNRYVRSYYTIGGSGTKNITVNEAYLSGE